MKSILATYRDRTPGSFTEDDKDTIREAFKSAMPCDLISDDDYVAFFDVLYKFRLVASGAFRHVGEGAKELFDSTLSVGEDGIYLDEYHFLYELIQNVDDCEYDDVRNCSLNVSFDTVNNNIELVYNEKGFTPKNVFAITGIAERDKNVSPDKIEIGEKGIGFKSVFGIADSVLIQSGKFFFEIDKSNSMLPLARYKDNQRIVAYPGTRLILKIRSSSVQSIYDGISDRYSKNEALFNKNPILFLNKLTSLSFNDKDCSRYMKFQVTARPDATALTEMFIEKDVSISVEIKGVESDKTNKNEISCYRYTMPIIYDRKSCVSRYGKETKFNTKKLYLAALFPHAGELGKHITKGSLYSFFPTKIDTDVPLSLHVPYKLDVSREYVDPQGCNDWFNHTNTIVMNFLKNIYADLSETLKNKVIDYLPKKPQYILVLGGDQKRCLAQKCYQWSNILDERVIYTSDSTYEKPNDVISLDIDGSAEEHLEIYSLLSLSEKLFIPPRKMSLDKYGITQVMEINRLLFKAAFKNPRVTDRALNIVVDKEYGSFDIGKSIDELGEISLSVQQVSAICSHNQIVDIFHTKSADRIKNDIRIPFYLSATLPQIDEESTEIIVEYLRNNRISENLMRYLKRIEYRFVVMDEIDSGMFFVFNNYLVLSMDNPLTAFAAFIKSINKNAFTAAMEMSQKSIELNKAVLDNKMSDYNFLLLLRAERGSIAQVWGSHYRKYIDLINESSFDSYRFINELLQNADDCKYPHGDHDPYFEFYMEKGKLITTYNEYGFDKSNVRAITSIGESTKRWINTGQANSTIGEKGVGFKSVFQIASTVIIRSRGFWFKLKAAKPTVPVVADQTPDFFPGTKMIFHLLNPLPEHIFSEKKALSICLCLRKLMKITLCSIKVEIDDSVTNYRNVFIDGEKYSFKKFVHDFDVTDETAIAERANFQRIITRSQRISIYLPSNKQAEKAMQMGILYCGLPTSVRLGIPLIIDAPFEVNTSRDCVLHRRWNNIIRDETYNALIKMLNIMRVEKGIQIMKYISIHGLYENDGYLNVNDNYLKIKLASEEIIPLLNGEFASAKSGVVVYPDICLYIIKSGLVNAPEGRIVSTDEQIEKLKWLGCKQADMVDVFSIIKRAVESGLLNSDERFRNELYKYLKREELKLQRSIINELSIIPVKPRQGGINGFVTIREKIYSSNESHSTSEYYLLDDRLLSADDCFMIFGKQIQKMDYHQKRDLYREKIDSWLCINNYQQTAELLLNEYKHNRAMLDTCRQHLIGGGLAKIPMKYLSGRYNIGSKFISDSSYGYHGEIINNLLTAPDYKSLAGYLGCSLVRSINYSDVSNYIGSLSANDIEDFLYCDLDNGYEIIGRFYRNGKIPDDLVKKYELDVLFPETDTGKSYAFRTEPVKNIDSLRRSIKAQELNRIVSKKISVRQPEKTISDSRERSLQKYESPENRRYVSCQMCKVSKQHYFMEVNAIEREPDYEWIEMHLCLCLECSKQFEGWRCLKNSVFYSEFISNILKANFRSIEPIEVSIADRQIHFTATHLAEVQTILERHRTLREKKQKILE